MHNHLYSLDDGTLEKDGDDGGYLLITCILTYFSDTVGYVNTDQSIASIKCPITYIH